MSSTPFGEHLKREREMRGVTLEEISAATRISTRFLDAIENGQWDRLPGGVFNRGFIRSIARFLGLDEESLVAEYSLERSDVTNTHPAPERFKEIPRNWKPAAVAAVGIALVIAGGFFAYRRYGASIVTRLHGRPVAARSYAAGGVGTPNPASLPAESSLASGTPDSHATGDQGVPPFAAGLALRIEASKPAYVKVMADGKTVFEGTLRAGDVKQFGGSDSFEIRSSESSALGLELNGQPVSPIGTGQPWSVTLTRDDLKPAVDGSH